MVGIVPAAARLRHPAGRPLPTELTVCHTNWLAAAGERLRGYRNSGWELEPLGELTSYATASNVGYSLVGGFQVVGSLVHLDFAAQPEFLRRFFYPQHPETVAGDLWAAG